MFFNTWKNKKTRVSQIMRAADREYITGYNVIRGDLVDRILALTGIISNPSMDMVSMTESMCSLVSV